MANNKNSKSKEKSGLIKGIVCFVVAAALLVGAFFGGAAWEKSKAEPPKEDEKQTEASGGLVIGDGENNGLRLMTANIARADFAAYGVSEQAESAYTLTATAVDDNGSSEGIPQNFEITADWENSESEWVSALGEGAALADYVTLNQTSASEATVSCLQAFGESVIITITAAGTEITATKRCEYVKRIKNLTYVGVETSHNFAGTANSGVLTFTYDVGTVQGETEFLNGKFTLNPTLMNNLKNNSYFKYFSGHGGSVAATNMMAKKCSGPINFVENGGVTFNYEDMLSTLSADTINNIKNNTNNFEYLKYALISVINAANNSYGGTWGLQFSFEFKYTYNGVEYGSSGRNFSVQLNTDGLGALPNISNINVESDPTGDFVF